MRRGNSLRFLVTSFYPWQVLQAFCALLRADGLTGVFSQAPVQWVRGMLSSGLQVSQRASSLDNKVRKAQSFNPTLRGLGIT